MTTEYSYPKNFNYSTGNVDGEFNSADFVDTNFDLLNYASLYGNNYFKGVNYFIDLFAQSVNGVNSSVFPYLANLTSDAQGQLDILQEQIIALMGDVSNSFTVNSLTVATNLTLGTETIDTSGNYVDTGGNICYKLAGNTYTLTPEQMIRIPNAADKTNPNIFTEDNTFQQDLYLGTEQTISTPHTDLSGNIIQVVSYSESGGNIKLSNNGTQYTIKPENLITLNSNTTNIANFISGTNTNISYINSQLLTMIESLTIGNVKTVSSSSKADANIYVNPLNPHNWILDLSIPKGSSPSDNDSSGAGGFLGSLGSAIAGGVVGGVVSVGLSSLISSLNQAGFQTAEDLANGLDQAKDDWQISEMQQKLQYQEASTLSNTTSWTSDLLVLSNNFDVSGTLLSSSNPIRLRTNGEVECSSINCSTDVNIGGNTQLNTLNVAHNVSSSIKFGNNVNNYAEGTISYISNQFPNPSSTENVGTLNIDASKLNVCSNVPSNTVNIGSTTNFSTVNINSLNTNITGILTINGVPYSSFNQYWNYSNGYIRQVGI